MAEDITFNDLVALSRIGPDTTVEKYGGLINSSFFDSANVLGTLSQKKLISFTTSPGGQNPITVTDTGKQLLANAAERANADVDNLDLTILIQIKGGKKAPSEVATSMNVSSMDLAMHLNRLQKQGYISYEFRSGNLALSLSEKGFSLASSGALPKPPPPDIAAPQVPSAAMPTPVTPPMQQPQQQPPQPAPVQPQIPLQQPTQQTTKGKRNAETIIAVLVAIVVILLVVMLVKYGII